MTTISEQRPDGVICVELVEPTLDELEDLADEFGVHELALEDAVKAHQRPKLETYGDRRFLVVKSTHYDDDAEEVRFGEIQMLFGDESILIIRHDPEFELDLQSDLGPDQDESPGSHVIVHRIVDQVVDGYAPVLEGFEQDVREVEETVFGADIYPTERIYRLKRQLLAFSHNTRSLIQPLSVLVEDEPRTMNDDLTEYFRDVMDHLQRVTTRTERASELVSEMLDANLAQVGIRQNEDMRKMSAWAAIFLLPTVLAGIWGMNFENMPELSWVWGYPTALGIMVVGTLLLYWRFRRSGWL
ncbi:MAG: magnesium and cobalt transport protein CorA [Actinobacteria bacterium]|nr:MAG: magnesium and cobalt transport protein CorA [Actinomycetota bacterium]